jgi:hypothetical protein
MAGDDQGMPRVPLRLFVALGTTICVVSVLYATGVADRKLVLLAGAIALTVISLVMRRVLHASAPVRQVQMRRRTAAEKRAYLEGLDDPENTSEIAVRWRALSPEQRLVSRAIVLGKTGDRIIDEHEGR